MFRRGRRLHENNRDFARRWDESLEASRLQLLPGQLELLGKISPAESIRQIGRATVVVLPSLFDEFSRALVESLILGRAVITTDQVGAATLVREHECGLVVPPGDPDALAHAIDAALAPGAPYAANARLLAHRLVHEFSPEAIALQLLHHFNEMLPSP